MNRKRLNALLRVGVSVLGIVVLLQIIDVREAAAALVQIDTWGFWGALALFQVGLVVRAARWWVLLRPHTQALPLWKLIRLYYFGMFFNLFLPTGFGGDVVRAAELGTEVPPAVSAATVVLDRMIGLMALFGIAVVALPFSVGVVPNYLLLLAGGVALVGLVGGVLVLQGRTFEAILVWLTARMGAVRFVGKVLGALTKFNDAVALVGHHRGALLGAFGYSTVFNIILVGMHVVLSAALGLDVPVAAYILIVPLTSVLLLIPSIQGLGVRDLSLVALVGVFTTETDAVAALSAAVILQNLVSGMIGLVLYGAYTVGRSQQRATDPIQPENQDSTA
jgi:glycosyltransferase 2 family protein